jgi:hypothetical protein
MNNSRHHILLGLFLGTASIICLWLLLKPGLGIGAHASGYLRLGFGDFDITIMSGGGLPLPPGAGRARTMLAACPE